MSKVILTAIISSVLTYMFVKSNEETKPTFEHPYIYWQDRLHRPEHGFEQAVDMYENEVGDTIFMQRSFGPNPN
jgi:hypothetical protein